MVTPEAVVMAPPARLMGLLPKKSAGRTQFSRNFLKKDTPASAQEQRARPGMEGPAEESLSSETYLSDLKYVATDLTSESESPATGFILPFPFLTVASTWSTVSALIAGSETGRMPMALAIPALGVPVGPWHMAHFVL